MARNLAITPKIVLDGSDWVLAFFVYDKDLRVRSKFKYVFPASVSSPVPIRLLKVAFDMIVDDTDTDQMVADAFVYEDIRSGPQVETVIGNWIGLAETQIQGLGDPWTYNDFVAAWTPNEVNAVIGDVRTLIKNRWTIPVGEIHYHSSEGSANV